MTKDQLEKAYKRMRFQLEMLASQASVLTLIMVQDDWTRMKLNRVHNVFEKYDKRLKEDEEALDRATFRDELKKVAGESSVRHIVSGMIEECRWTDVCNWLVDKPEEWRNED